MNRYQAPRHLLILCAFLAVLPLVSGCSKSQSRSERLEKLATMIIPPPPDVVTVEILGYCPAQDRTFLQLFASNFSTKVLGGELLADTDYDGVPDNVELSLHSALNISPQYADSNGDQFSDLLMLLSGIDQLQQSRLRCDDPADNDGDGISVDEGNITQFIGLRNCEEKRLTQTDPNKFDTDGDQIPDYLELRCGLNPLDPVDARLDTDGDGVTNINECKFNTPVAENNNDLRVKQLAYSYQTELDTRGGNVCMRFKVGNIPVLHGGVDNLLAFYLIEEDGLHVRHLYTAHLLLEAGVAGKTLTMDFGPAPKGRFIAK